MPYLKAKYSVFIGIHTHRFLFEFECQLLVLDYVMVMLKIPLCPFRWQVDTCYVF